MCNWEAYSPRCNVPQRGEGGSPNCAYPTWCKCTPPHLATPYIPCKRHPQFATRLWPTFHRGGWDKGGGVIILIWVCLLSVCLQCDALREPMSSQIPTCYPRSDYQCPRPHIGASNHLRLLLKLNVCQRLQNHTSGANICKQEHMYRRTIT